MTALATGWQAGRDVWTHGPRPTPWDNQQALYATRWLMYSGELFQQSLAHSPFANNTAIYQHTNLLWKHIEAVVDFYAGVIYQGALATNGESLPEDVPNAIPFDPQTGNDERNAQIMTAIAELESAWNWQQKMHLAPMYSAALGDCLTELVDLTDRRFVYPRIVWPGYVKDVELDDVDNVRAYTLEYIVQEKQADGTPGEQYTYRKVVDGDVFRHYRNDRLQREVKNPYGFVPAVWDRHRIGAPGMVRGRSATDGTRQALLRLNSLFSHSLDFQHKAFWVPFMVAGQNGSQKKQTVDLGAPPEATSIAEMMRWIKVAEGSSLLQPEFDIGKTLDMIQDIREGILAENPEASFYQQLREMTQVTAPGAERMMGDVKNRVDLVRGGADTQMVKRFQMAIAMCGFRAHDRTEDGWLANGNRLDRRRQVFTPFDLQSFGRGELDMSILSRPIVHPTELERIEAERAKVAVLEAKERLQLQSSWQALGLEETDAQARITERESTLARTANLMDGLGPIGE